jgi:hypothetical protein
MPIQIRGKEYAAPNETGQPGVLGKELVEIEEHFGLDAMTLLATLNSHEPSPFPGYTKTKAFFAFAWICLSRGGEIVSIQDVLDEYSLDEIIDISEEESKKESPALLQAESSNE